MKSRVAAAVVAGSLLFAACQPKAGSAAPAAPPAKAKDVRGTFVILGPDDRSIPAGIAVFDVGRYDNPRWEGLPGDEYALYHARYDVLIEYFGQKHWLRNEALGGGETVVRLPMATLALEIRSSRGDRLTGDVDVFATGSDGKGTALMKGETFEELPVLAGMCDVRARVQGRERWVRNVVLIEGERVVETLIEPVGYVMADVVDERGEPLGADVWVYGTASRRDPAALGRAGERIPVIPGRYDLTVRYGGERDYSSALTVLENQTTTEVFTFFRGSSSDGQ